MQNAAQELDIPKLIQQDLQSISDKQIGSFRLIRSKRGVHVYHCLYSDLPAVVKYFEKEDDKRELLNYRILMQLGIPTIEILAFGESTLVMEDISASQDWRLGVAQDLDDVAVARRLAQWYFAFHEKGAGFAGLDSLYCEFDSVTKENIELLTAKLHDAKELFQFLLSSFDELHSLIDKPSFTLTYNDFYWTNFVVRKDKLAAMMFDYNLLGRGYRFSDLRNVCSSLSQPAGKAFTAEYERLYYQQHGRTRREEELAEAQIDGVAAPLFNLIAAFEQEKFPSWAEGSKAEALNGTLLSKAKQLLR